MRWFGRKAKDARGDGTVRIGPDVALLNGTDVTLLGRYEAVMRPIRGKEVPPRPADRAVIVLEDGTEVYVEPLDSAESVRSSEERWRLNGRRVRANGTIHKVMPAAGESPVVPCLAEVRNLEIDS